MTSLRLPGSDASRPRSGSLNLSTAASPLSQNAHNGSSDSSRKRKRETRPLPMEELLKPSIVVKPHPSSLTVRPRMLHPLMLLPREHLPLSAIDLAAPTGDLPVCRFYESSIKILDLEGRLGSNVLLARSETNRAVYAIERHEGNLYVLCKLGAWVDVWELSQLATVVCKERIRQTKPAAPAIATQTPTTTLQQHNDNKKRRLAIEEIQSLVRKRPRSQSMAGTDISQDQSQLPSPAETTSEAEIGETGNPQKPSVADRLPSQAQQTTAEAIDDNQSQPTADDIFQSIRTQYFEALYHSMGSLAYFAKGPLSRARAAFHLDCDANLEMNDLIEFLKSLIMTTVIIDKKYRESVPDVLSNMKTLVEESDNGDAKSKKRKSRKMKLGKDGLYPLEAEHIRKWWIARQPPLNGEYDKSLTAEEIKYHISFLRRRETQLQMILILEILAIEPLGRSTDAAEDSQLPGMGQQNAAPDASNEAPKKRNKHNFPVLLDVHADRLCIWQSTTLDETKSLAESQAINQGHEGQQSERANSDPLRDFCVDILLPFFSARLPDICDSVNRKLGGPAAMKSPPKAEKSKPALPPKQKPGAPAKRPTARKNKERTLERVLSNEKMRQRSVSRGPQESSAIARLRNSMATIIPGLKREASEPLMSMIPATTETNALRERPVNVFSRSTSMSGSLFGDDKARKKALVDAELRDAISALKKPNRALVGKEIVDAAEKRTSAGISQLRKSKKPSRDPTAPAVVKATPANSRFRDVLGTTSHRSQHQLPAAIAEGDFVPSSASVVPASSMPQTRHKNLLPSPQITSTPPIPEGVQATPARAAPSSAPSLGSLADTAAIPPSSPVMTRKAALTSTSFLAVPSKFRSGSTWDMPSSPGLPALFETPIKARPSLALPAIGDTPIKSRLANAGGKMDDGGGGGGGTHAQDNSGLACAEADARTAAAAPAAPAKKLTIYQQLGWDDDDLDDLA